MPVDRRTFLRTLSGGCAAGALAGCSGLTGGDGDGTASPTDAPTGTTESDRSGADTAEPPSTDPGTTVEVTSTKTRTRTPAPDPVVDVPDDPRRSASQFDPSDGFAEMAPWLDDDVAVFTVTEPTRANLERAVNQPIPRVVVFETSGTIDLGGERFGIRRGKCWIAGQTAPDPGITLIRGDLGIYADDCVVQHVRVRPGDDGGGGRWEPDSIRTADGSENNVVDHCTATWSVDENVSPGYETDRTTVTNCLVAEPLRDATHHKGEHNYGMLVGDDAKRVTVAGNLFADNVERNPRLKQGTESVVVNNGAFHFRDGVWMDPDTESSIEGNVYRTKTADKPTIFGEGTAHVADNDQPEDMSGPLVGDGITEVAERPLWPDGLERLPSDETLSHDYRHAGARPANRTEHDERVIEKMRTGDLFYVDSQDDVGGYPELEVNERELRVPDTGLRAWLREHARAVEPS